MSKDQALKELYTAAVAYAKAASEKPADYSRSMAACDRLERAALTYAEVSER